MDFSTEFVALRDKLLNGQDPHFRSQQNVQVSGRMAALLSVFNSRTPRKILGLMPTGGTSHAHEYRLLFAVPSLDEQTLDDWMEVRAAGQRRAGKAGRKPRFFAAFGHSCRRRD